MPLQPPEKQEFENSLSITKDSNRQWDKPDTEEYKEAPWVERGDKEQEPGRNSNKADGNYQVDGANDKLPGCLLRKWCPHGAAQQDLDRKCDAGLHRRARIETSTLTAIGGSQRGDARLRARGLNLPGPIIKRA